MLRCIPGNVSFVLSFDLVSNENEKKVHVAMDELSLMTEVLRRDRVHRLGLLPRSPYQLEGSVSLAVFRDVLCLFAAAFWRVARLLTLAKKETMLDFELARLKQVSPRF